MIKWNEVTWYSKFLAFAFFIGVMPALLFYLGTQYELTVLTFPTNAERYESSISNQQKMRARALAQPNKQSGLLATSTLVKSSPFTLPDSGIEGRVTIGTNCNPDTSAHMTMCDDHTYATTLDIISADRTFQTSVEVANDGFFRAPLAPGEYEIRQHDTSVFPRLLTVGTIDVVEKHFTFVVVEFDSGQ